jgi:hypothetical protein
MLALLQVGEPDSHAAQRLRVHPAPATPQRSLVRASRSWLAVRRPVRLCGSISGHRPMRLNQAREANGAKGVRSSRRLRNRAKKTLAKNSVWVGSSWNWTQAPLGQFGVVTQSSEEAPHGAALPRVITGPRRKLPMGYGSHSGSQWGRKVWTGATSTDAGTAQTIDRNTAQCPVEDQQCDS